MMNNLHKISAKSWIKKKPASPHKFKVFLLLIYIFTLLLFIFFFTKTTPISLLSITLANNNDNYCYNNIIISQCTKFLALTLREKFLWYAPHSGFSNQLSEFKNAILMAGILNRTLIVLPVIDHHAVAPGSCPKFRVSGPKEIRFAVWDHVLELIKTGRYVSMADIIDISSLVPTLGFVGTDGSTIAESIELMRKSDVCSKS